MTVPNSRAKTMGAFLKSRRERLSPENAGLKFSSGPRKTPGLRREEVAILAGVSATYYTWLEQGRELSASREVIEGIASALQLSPDERGHLLQLWNPYGPDPNYADSAPPAAVDPQLQKIIDQVAYPSYITNNRTEVLAWNEAARRLLTDFASVPAEKRSLIRLAFENGELQRRIVNIDEFASYGVAVFRTHYDKHRDDPWFEATVQHLMQSSEEFHQLWKPYEIRLKKLDRVILQPSASDEPVAYDIRPLANLSDNPDLHICVYIPSAEDHED
ncbi:transcriptional regulator with XRE-family HTH domain [Paenibacillus rhizosphaerae]|uniref:Transcriptional regulator with XRE-family HTH domain n=1 Tax=Paenibacillus rhizosphaerae TaxID=297318 RepID=A0A839TWJ4_9BACL|nr:helix-turn-helix transcriptional regulator [Paenibacillus rhizosphaerae]MBB3131215.1 transcriptional regulator with XRE-family HTH domain [Paenibacillus rhizosphaerae]